MTATELPGCLIVTGMPGSGKSTVTRLIAHLLQRSARLNGDDVNEMILSGRVWALGEPAVEAERQVALCFQNLSALAHNFAEAGFTPVVDHVVASRAQLDFLVSLLAPQPVLFVVLAPGLEVCRARNAARGPVERVDYDFSGLGADMSRELGDVGWWFDTSDRTPEETAAQIVREAPEHAVLRRE